MTDINAHAVKRNHEETTKSLPNDHISLHDYYALYEFGSRYYDGMWDPCYKLQCGNFPLDEWSYIRRQVDKAYEDLPEDLTDPDDISWNETLMVCEDELAHIQTTYFLPSND